MPTLSWIGKKAVEKHHLEIPFSLLEYDESLSVGDKESGGKICLKMLNNKDCKALNYMLDIK